MLSQHIPECLTVGDGGCWLEPTAQGITVAWAVTGSVAHGDSTNGPQLLDT